MDSFEVNKIAGGVLGTPVGDDGFGDRRECHLRSARAREARLRIADGGS